MRLQNGPDLSFSQFGRSVLLAGTALPGQTSVLMLAPPLTITKNEIDFAMGVFDKALEIADAETTA